jgi:phage-related protein
LHGGINFDTLRACMPQRTKPLHVVFFATGAGREPVREWLKELDKDDRREIGADILAVQLGWPLGLPLCRSLGKGLWEVRSSLPSRRIARVIFAFDDGTIVLLNGFIKKTQKTPAVEIDTALKRLKEMTS